jgi:tRNA1Val (adenine37-N6)-methyltransferase
MNCDAMWPGGPVFIRDDSSFRPGTDAVLLAAFAAGGKSVGGKSAGGRAASAMDLGSGTGVVAILLAWADASLTVDGVEIQPSWASLARENVRLNGLEGRVSIMDGDLRRHREFLRAGAYDLVVSNPPYYAAGSGKSAPLLSRAQAREERESTLQDVVQAARYLTRWGGRFALVQKPERLSEVICALSQSGLEPKRLRFVQNKASSAPSLVLLESRRGARPSLTVEPPLILTDENGGESEEIKRIYHRE